MQFRGAPRVPTTLRDKPAVPPARVVARSVEDDGLQPMIAKGMRMTMHTKTPQVFAGTFLMLCPLLEEITLVLTRFVGHGAKRRGLQTRGPARG